MGRTLALGAVATAMLLACNAFTPAGFWRDYRHELVSAQFSDQGPWGGHRWVQWASHNIGEFSVAAATRFAEAHGWKRVRSRHYSAQDVSAWITSGVPVFPLVYENHGMTSNFDCTSFPRAMEGPLNVVWFDSGWVRVAPDTGTDETAFGFVVVSDDGQQLAVYHAWGEL